MYHNLEELTVRIIFLDDGVGISSALSLLYPYTFLCKAEQINCLHLKISIYVLHTVLFTFPVVLTRIQVVRKSGAS